MNHLVMATWQSKAANIATSSRSVLMLFWIITLALVLLPTAHAQEPIGHVIEIEGNWILNEGKPLEKWQGVPAGGVIRISSPGQYDRVTIAAGNTIIVSRICSQPDSCNQPITLPSREAAHSTIWRWITDKLFGDEGRYKSQSIRGEAIHEAVALLKDEQLDLSAMFQKMPKGAYEIVIHTLPREGKRRSLGPISVEWDLDKPSLVSVPPVLMPGLYQFELSSSPAALRPEAWVLVRSPDDYKKVADSFAEAKEMTKKWADLVKPETTSSFLRAYLDYLATSGAK